MSWIRPSVAPSSASHLPRTAFETSWRSAVVKPVDALPARRGEAQVRLVAGDVGRRRERQAPARVARQEAVVLVGVARGGDERVAPAVRAAAEVGAVGALAVGRLDHRLGHRRQLGDGLVAVVQARLRIDAEGRVLRGVVAGVGADHGEALRERARRRAAAEAAVGGGDAAVRAAVGLVEEPAVPAVRQAHLEADGVALGVDRADPVEHAAGEQAVGGHRVAGDGERAGRHRAGGRERRVGERRPRREVGARRQAGAGRDAELRHRVVVVVAAAGGQKRGESERRSPREPKCCDGHVISWGVASASSSSLGLAQCSFNC